MKKECTFYIDKDEDGVLTLCRRDRTHEEASGFGEIVGTFVKYLINSLSLLKKGETITIKLTLED